MKMKQRMGGGGIKRGGRRKVRSKEGRQWKEGGAVVD